MTPIKVYLHCYMVNHYLEVVDEIFNKLTSSGLYEQCSKVYVGCLGSSEELKKLQTYLSKYPKVEIAAYSNNEKEYEFFTLRVLKKHCDESKEKFFALYCMTKGVSYGKEHELYEGGKFWLDYMIDWNITKWRKNYKALNMKFRGYDISGVKVIPARESPSNRVHFSGNWWMANSDYIKSLRKIETLNKNDRWEAEMWSTSGQPIIYMPCNLFIDYMVKGNYYDFIKNYSELNDFTIE